MKESAIQKWIQEQLKSKFRTHIYIFKVPQGQYISRRGIPDIICAIRGRFYAIEVKTTIGKLTKLQQFEISKIAYAFTIHGKDSKSLDSFIERVENETKDNKEGTDF